MKLSHTLPPVSAVFDDPDFVSSAGLIPVVRLAQDAGLPAVADEYLSVTGAKGAHGGDEVMSLVAGGDSSVDHDRVHRRDLRW